jgi:hypothetical protein
MFISKQLLRAVFDLAILEKKRGWRPATTPTGGVIWSDPGLCGQDLPFLSPDAATAPRQTSRSSTPPSWSGRTWAPSCARPSRAAAPSRCSPHSVARTRLLLALPGGGRAAVRPMANWARCLGGQARLGRGQSASVAILRGGRGEPVAAPLSAA